MPWDPGLSGWFHPILYLIYLIDCFNLAPPKAEYQMVE